MNRFVTILCVDDSVMVHKFLHSILHKDYANLLFAHDGFEGVSLYKKHTPQIVISDINMPKMNGLEMVKKIKAINKAAVIVMMTTESSKHSIIQAASEGVSGYVNKNNARNEIKTTIDKLVALLAKKSEDKTQNPFAHLQAFLELSDEMSLLTDGVKIFSCNHHVLEFLELPNLEAFTTEYSSIEFLVESVQGVNASDFNSAHWIEHLLSAKTRGTKVQIIKKDSAITLNAKAIQIQGYDNLYAVVFTAPKKETPSTTTGTTERTYIFNDHTKTLSKPFFLQLLPTFTQNVHRMQLPMTLIAIRINDVDETNFNPSLLEHIVDVIASQCSAQEMLFTFEKGFIIVGINRQNDEAKQLAKKLLGLFKKQFDDKELQTKFGFSPFYQEQQKTQNYLEKFLA